MTWVILAISMTAFLGGTIVRKYFSDRVSGNAGTFLFNAVASVVSALVLLVWGGFGSASLFTLLLGIAFGLVVAVQAIANLKALEMGPMSYTQMIVSFSTLISALSGAIFWGEKLQWAHIAGIALMLISFVLTVETKGETKKISWGWLIMAILAFLFNGCIGIMQKLHQSSAYKSELNAFLVIAFVISFVFSMIVYAFLRVKESKELSRTKDSPRRGALWIIIVFMVLNGVAVAANHKLNLYLSGVMESAVFFPIVNGGGLVTSMLAAVILFKERLSIKQWIGVAFGTASVILLCNPF